MVLSILSDYERQWKSGFLKFRNEIKDQIETLNVSEVFESVQGEGRYIGKPGIFIRLAGCNLSCWFCDTPYTWKKEEQYPSPKKSFYYKKMAISYLVKWIQKSGFNYIVFTGGEPFLQQREIIELINQLNMPKLIIGFETNGTIAPDDELLMDFRTHFVISPKNNVSMDQKVRSAEVHDKWFKPFRSGLMGERITFKFVINEDDDFEQVLKYIDEYRIDPSLIYMMPEGTDIIGINGKLQMLFKYAKLFNVNVTTRLQILAYGNKRGT